MKKVSVNTVLGLINDKINELKVKKFTDKKHLTDELNEFLGNDLIDQYINQEEFHDSLVKKKKDKLSHNDPFLNGVSNLADFYGLEKIIDVRHEKGKVGLNESLIDDGEDLPLSIQKGLEVHIDLLEQYTNKNDKKYRFSERYKKKLRDVAVFNDLDKYPLLKENYFVWLEFGLIYGFHNDYTKEQKEKLENEWLDAFGKEDHPLTPQVRYGKLKKMYNDLGYELSILRQQLAKPVHSRNYDQSHFDNMDDILEVEFDLSNPKHIAGLLSIQKDKKAYIPLYYILKGKYINKVDTALYTILKAFDEALSNTYFNDVQGDIIKLLTNTHDDTSVIEQTESNPYELIRSYINNKYNLNKTKANIIHMIDEQIVLKIAHTYQALKDEIETEECTQCHKDKLLINDNYGNDTHKKSGFKSICKPCLAEMQEKYR